MSLPAIVQFIDGWRSNTETKHIYKAGTIQPPNCTRINIKNSCGNTIIKRNNMNKQIRKIETLKTESNKKMAFWNSKLTPEIQWMIEENGCGLDALNRDEPWIPIHMSLKSKNWDIRIALYALREFGLVRGENLWHPKLREYGMISVINYTESDGITGYVGEVTLALVSKRGESFLESFLLHVYHQS